MGVNMEVFCRINCSIILFLMWTLISLCEVKVQHVSQHKYSIPAPSPRSSYPYFVSASVPELHEDLYKKVFRVMLNQGLFFNNNVTRNQSPFEFRTPEELRRLIDFTLPETGVGHDELVNLIEKIFKYSPHTSHPFRVDRHSSGLDPQGLLGDWMATAMTAPMATYKESPVFTLMEDAVLERVRQLIGYRKGRGDGVLVAGSSTGNSYALQTALQNIFPDWRNKGVMGGNIPRVAIFISEDALFSYEKYCIWEGIGLSACIRVQTDPNGRMSIAELKKQIQVAIVNGRVPLMVVATAGTPILGAIDPIQEIGKIARANGMWFHVDGQAAGSYFLSSNLKYKMAGIENCDSFLWNLEKSLALPAVSAILVSRKQRVFSKVFSLGADVLFRNTSLYDSAKWDNGDKTMESTRRPSVTKLWFAFKSKGQERLAQHLEYSSKLKLFTVSHLKSKDEAFTLIVSEFDSNQVAFYYIPSSIRSETKQIKEQLLMENKFTERLKVILLRQGVLSISVDTISQQRNSFFVMSLRNSALSKEDVRYMIAQIEYYGEKIPLIEHSLSSEADALKPELALPMSTDESSKPSVPPALTSYPDFVSAPIEKLHQEAFKAFFDEVLKIGTFFEDKRSSDPALLFNTPEELLSRFDFSLANSTGLSTWADLATLRQLVKYSAHNAHPYFDIHLAEAIDAYGQMGDYIISALNSALVTYEDNPVLTLMEEELVKAIIKLVGYPEGRGTGLVVPGGSASNQIAMLLAMKRKVPTFYMDGHNALNKTFVAFLSRQAHYATNKGAFFTGIGLENAVYVETDGRGRMDPKDLEVKIRSAMSEGKIPFYVCATAGTTVLGAIDPINEIANIAQKYKLWLHVDGTYGGATLLSNDKERKRSRLYGIERGDSFTFNAHKALAASRLITCFVTRHANILQEVAPPTTSQEFNNQILYNPLEHDGGITHLFPERRASVLKLWLMWKAKGRKGLGEHIDYGFDLTAKTYEHLVSMKDTYAMAHPGYPPELTSINFYYLPERYRGIELRESVLNELAEIQVKIDDTVIRENALFLSVEGVKGVQNTLILSLYNSALTFADVEYMLQVIDYYGKSM